MAAATLEKAAQREISWKWRLMMVTGWTGGQPAPCMYLFAVMYYVCLLSGGKTFFFIGTNSCRVGCVRRLQEDMIDDAPTQWFVNH